MTEIKWNEEIENLRSLSNQKKSIGEIGKIYGVSRQRIYQIFMKFDLPTTRQKQPSFLRGKGPRAFWLNKSLSTKKVPKEEREKLVDKIETPDFCPIFGIRLNYEGTGGYRNASSPSLDQIKPGGGYIEENIQVISWRANRLKSDATPEELRLLADYMEDK